MSILVNDKIQTDVSVHDIKDCKDAAVSKDGKPKATSFNYSLVIDRIFKDQLALSVFDDNVYLGGEKLPQNFPLDLRMNLGRIFGVSAKEGDANDALVSVASRNVINPVAEMLKSLPAPKYKNCEILDRWLIDICGAEDTKINRVIARKWLISAVARGMQPGCYVEGTLILVGAQGIGKSRLFKELNLKPEWASDQDVICDNAMETATMTNGKHICELSELANLSKKDLEFTKQFMTKCEDEFRRHYTHTLISKKRMFVLAGTSNADVIVKDPTGSRRMWCVKVKGVFHVDPNKNGKFFDIELLKGIKEEIWAEAFQAYMDAKGDASAWVLSGDEREMLEASNDSFRDMSLREELEEILPSILAGGPKKVDYVLQSEIKTHLAEFCRVNRVHVSDQMLKAEMSALGWKHAVKKGGYSAFVAPPQTEEAKAWEQAGEQLHH